jgi:outer membrane protein assembly factor BamE
MISRHKDLKIFINMINSIWNKRMKKWFIGLAAILLSTGCSRSVLYQPDIDQGNCISPQQIQQIHTGMNRAEVERILGHPILKSTFAQNRMTYMYTFKKAHSPISMQQFILHFKGNQVTQIEKKM